jgi:hypothetical protein
MQAMENFNSKGGAEVSAYVEAATNAARRGDLTELDLNLAKLRLVAPIQIDELAEKLHGLARSVRSHPSFGGLARQRPASATG